MEHITEIVVAILAALLGYGYIKGRARTRAIEEGDATGERTDAALDETTRRKAIIDEIEREIKERRNETRLPNPSDAADRLRKRFGSDD